MIKMNGEDRPALRHSNVQCSQLQKRHMTASTVEEKNSNNQQWL